MGLYAAYASNLSPDQMQRRAPHSPVRGPGWLAGWRLTFGGEDRAFDGALATVVQAPAEQVFVLLYDMPPADEKALDAWEGGAFGLYRKLRVRIDTLEGQALAWLYVLNGYEGGLPSERYITIMADAAEEAGAPADYVRWLRGLPCR